MNKDSYLKKTLSRNLKLFRQAKKITQDHLEELSGVSKYTISDIETCVSWPCADTLEKLAAPLGIKATDFFNDSDNPVADISIRENTLNQVRRDLKSVIDKAIDNLDITFKTTHSKLQN